MKKILKYSIVLILFSLLQPVFGQPDTLPNYKIEERKALKELPEEVKYVLTFEEYLGYVKQHHPLLKQANLKLSVGEANLLRARGGFDPKIEVDYNRKKFKNTEYYDELNTTFKIPTWYGIELKANFEENTGQFLNPSVTVPEGGLYSAGVSFSLAQGFFINKRMATLKKAKFFLDQTAAERDLLVNNLIFEASKAYFEWVKAYNEQTIYENFLSNAVMRFKGVKRGVDVGDKAAIDSIEAKIVVQNRRLNLEAVRLKTRKIALEASNYLWLNSVPLQIREKIVPELPNKAILSNLLYLEGITSISQTNHPKIRSLNAKITGLEIDRAYKRNKLLPKLDLQYNFITADMGNFDNFNTSNYKAGVNFSFPLFLRKERGEVRLANLKLQDVNYERIAASLNIQNKIDAVYASIDSLEEQQELISDIVVNYETLLIAEERKFQLGESSLFLINSREQKLIQANLKANELQIKFLNANASLYNALGISEQ